MLNLKLPDYEVIIHLQYNSFGKRLEGEILLDTANYELDESTEHQGIKDFHWTFKSWNEAVAAGEILKKYCNNPNLILLKVKANNSKLYEPIIHKKMTIHKKSLNKTVL